MLGQFRLEPPSDQIFWFTVRVTGIVAMFTISASIITGILTSSRLLGSKPSFPWLNDLHRFFSSLTMILLVGHLAGLYLDNFVAFSIDQVLVPFVASFEDSFFADDVVWLILGSVAFWLAFVIDVTSRFKKKLNKTLWHTIHLLSFPVLGLSALHAWKLGSDVDNRALLLLAAVLAAAIVLFVFGRLFQKLRSL